MITVAIATLGCKVNQFESEALMASLEGRGYSLVPFGEAAQITIINTCTVTHRADFQSRQMVRRAFRSNPESLLIVTGCYADVDPAHLAEIPGVKHVVGNVEKSRLADLLPLMEAGQFPAIRVSDIQKQNRFLEVPLGSFHRHTRAFLKIQDGCDARCTYCIVPYARGPSRSLAPEILLTQVTALKQRGYREVVLTGIHIGAYGRDLDPPLSLEALLERMEETDSPSRIRVSSIEPHDFSPGLVSILSRSKKICPHLHVPVQSGDDETLRRMNRPYDRAFLSRLVEDLSGKIPDLCIGADLIIGFPGETGEGFEQTRRFIEGLPIAYLHVFPFSGRRGTPAVQFSKQVPEDIKKRRAELMRRIGNQKRHAFYRRFLHRELSVLVEDRHDKETGRITGFSKNYIPVMIDPDNNGMTLPTRINEELRVKAITVSERGVTGRVMED